MPILQIRTEGRWVEVLLNRRGGGHLKAPPLTLGSGRESTTHIHIPSGAVAASLIGSGVSIAYSFVLRAKGLIVNGRLTDDLRVLRHGDRISLGGTEMYYLEFAVRRVAEGSELAGERCTSANCTDEPIKTDDEYVLCPWCGRVYHASCWLATEKCGGQTRGCYPVRRLLMGTLSDKLKIEKMADLPDLMRQCRAGCEEMNREGEKRVATPLRIGQEYLRCPNPHCRVPYHIHCLLRMRGPCPACDFEFASMIDGRLAGTDKGAFSQ